MSPVAITVAQDTVLRELAPEIEIARAAGGRWFGLFSMQPLSVTDKEVQDLDRDGLLRVIEWDDGPADGSLRQVPDLDSPTFLRAARTRSRPTRARLSTDGGASLDR